MTRKIPIIVGVLLVLVLVAFNVTYTVSYNEVAIKSRFGALQRVEHEPGLHFKAPFFVDRVTKIDRRLQLVDSPLDTVQTRDGQQVLVQAYLLWRVAPEDAGIRSFFGSYESIEAATPDLGAVLQQALRTLTGGFDFNELVGPGNRLAEAEARVMEELRRTVPAGIAPISVGLSQIVLPPRTSTAVVRRMQATQERLAEAERARGIAEADSIKSQAATKADKLRGFAEQRASAIESEGTAAARGHYERLRENEELAIFLSWLEAFRTSMSGNVTIFMDTRQAPMHLLDFGAATGTSGIPQPSAASSPRPRGTAPGRRTTPTDPQAGAEADTDGAVDAANGEYPS